MGRKTIGTVAEKVFIVIIGFLIRMNDDIFCFFLKKKNLAGGGGYEK